LDREKGVIIKHKDKYLFAIF